jgi:membrane-bound lytic murein transglycosylase MltF
VHLAFVPDSLEDEDMIEMLDAGLFEALVVDDWKARMWAQVLPKVAVRTDVVLRPEATTGLLAFASYNAGPGNIAKMRREAEKRGLDPDSGLTMSRSSWGRGSARRRPPTYATSTSTTSPTG